VFDENGDREQRERRGSNRARLIHDDSDGAPDIWEGAVFEEAEEFVIGRSKWGKILWIRAFHFAENWGKSSVNSNERDNELGT
jgi:hypothetical protein